MNKRKFLKSTCLVGLASFINPLSLFEAKAKEVFKKGFKAEAYSLPDLPYPIDALEPYIDKLTMEIHHGRHHKGYVDKLNEAMAGTDMQIDSLENLFKKVSQLPVSIRNNAGGHYNHSLFWTILSPKGGGSPKAELMAAINKSFGSFEKFKEQFSQAAKDRFGSGWAWLVKDEKGNLKITSTPNQDNPLMDISEVKGIPLLGLDVWEHACYLKYQNKRAEYITAFWNLVHWEEVEKRYKS